MNIISKNVKLKKVKKKNNEKYSHLLNQHFFFENHLNNRNQSLFKSDYIFHFIISKILILQTELLLEYRHFLQCVGPFIPVCYEGIEESGQNRSIGFKLKKYIFCLQIHKTSENSFTVNEK